MTENISRLLSILPSDLRASLVDLNGVEEIRILRGRNIQLRMGNVSREIPLLANEALIRDIIDRSTDWSPHGVMEMLRRGYLILPGGHRLGLCGTGVYKDGTLSSLRDISSINIRIARDIPEFGLSVADFLAKSPSSVLCMGPPGRGKTTLLRNMIYHLSSKYHERIAVIDERLELASSIDGCPQFDLGPTVDIMSGIQKAQAIDMLLRTMGPGWIAVDEITAVEDVDAMIRGAYCGVKLIATAHGNSSLDLKTRPIYKKLLDSHIFDYLFLILPDRTIQKEDLRKCSVS